MKARLTLAPSDRYYAVADTGKGVMMDAGPKEEKIAPSPLELVLMGTAGCTAVDVVDILRKKREPLAGFEIEIEAERAPEPPRVFTRLMVKYIVYGDVRRESVEQAVELSQEKYCSASVMVRRSGAEVETSVEVRPAAEMDASGKGKGR